MFGLQHTEPTKKFIFNLVKWERFIKWHLCPSSFLPLPALCVFVLRSNGTLDVWGDGEGVAVRSVKSVALGAQEAALLDGPAPASAPGGAPLGVALQGPAR